MDSTYVQAITMPLHKKWNNQFIFNEMCNYSNEMQRPQVLKIVVTEDTVSHY
jgi:hypothetical protein